MTSQLLVPMFIYLVMIFAVAFWTRKTSHPSDNFLSEYFLGNRSLGGLVLAMTMAATYTSASSFIGGPGAAYKYGLGWVLLAMIQVPAAWLTLGVLGKKFAIEARIHNAVTLNDILFAKYQNKAIVIIASSTILLTFIGMMAVQFVGGARLVQAVTGISYLQGLTIFACTIGLYTSIGGFRTVAMTDALQGLMMVVGTIALLIGVIHTGGGLAEIIGKMHSIDPNLVTPFGEGNSLSQSFMLSFWVLVCFGIIGTPAIAIRCMSYRSSKALHQGMVISTAVIAFLMLGMHLAGALGRAIVPDLSVTDEIMPTLMITVLPPLVAGIFLAGPMAAIMSSVDSLLIQSSATLLKDLYLNYINPSAAQDQQFVKKLPKISMWFTGIFLTIVFVASISPPDMLIWLNLLSLGAMQAVFLWPLVLGLYWPKATAKGALTSMVCGLGSYVYFSIAKPDLGGVHAIVPTLTIGLVSFVIISSIEHMLKTKQLATQ